jgi:hypothetical protein
VVMNMSDTPPGTSLAELGEERELAHRRHRELLRAHERELRAWSDLCTAVLKDWQGTPEELGDTLEMAIEPIHWYLHSRVKSDLIHKRNDARCRIMRTRGGEAFLLASLELQRLGVM